MPKALNAARKKKRKPIPRAESPDQAPQGRERRRAPRINVNLQAHWEGDRGLQQANVTSLSTLGCFVLSGGQVKNKELIRLEMVFPDEATSAVWGEVVEAADEIGFALNFTSSEEADQTRIEEFIQLNLPPN